MFDLRRGEKSIALSNLTIITHGKTFINRTAIISLKYQHPHGMLNLSYQIDQILYQIFKIILNIFKKNIMKRLLIHQ